MGWGSKAGLSSECNCLEPIVSEGFSFSDIREGSDSADVTIVVGTELLFDAETYLGSIRIFLNVLELGSISDALVSGGFGGFVEGVPRVVDAGAEGVTTVTWQEGATQILLSSVLGGQSGESGILAGRSRGTLNWDTDTGCGQEGTGARVGVHGSAAWGCFLQLELLVPE